MKVSDKVAITKKQFEDTLVKVFTQPVSGKPLEADQEEKQTSKSHPSDGYSGKHKSQGKTVDVAIEVYKGLIRNYYFDLLADVPTAATPIVAILSHQTRIPMISPEKEEKERGIIRKIDGVFHKGQTALLVDDLITQADSKFEMIRVLEENGLVVRRVVVLLDREQVR
jgi:orotate phosphoribosyltransferase